MDRRNFLKCATATGLAVGLSKATANAAIPEHNWDRYDWGSRPLVPDRLYQGPVPTVWSWCGCSVSDVIMVTSPSKDIVSNYGRGLIVYALDDTATLDLPGQTLQRTLEDLIKLPFAQKIYRTSPQPAERRQKNVCIKLNRPWVSETDRRSSSDADAACRRRMRGSAAES